MPFILFSSKFHLDVKERYQKVIKAVTESVTSVSYNLHHNNISPKLLEFLLKGHSVINIKKKLSSNATRKLFIQELLPFLANRALLLTSNLKNPKESQFF